MSSLIFRAALHQGKMLLIQRCQAEILPMETMI